MVRVGVVAPVGEELDLGAAEAEAVEAELQREREVAIGVRRELVTSAVDVELFPLNETFRVGKQHDADGEYTESALVGREDLTCPANRTAPVTETELCRNDEDVVILLLVAELLEHLHRLGVLSQVLRSELAVTVVVELPLRRDHCEHLIDGLTVGRRERLPLRDGEPPFGVRGKRLFGDTLVGEADTREELTQDVGLLRDPLDLVALGIRVAGLHFLVLELVGDRQILQRGEGGRADGLGEIVAVFDDALCARIVETELSENLLDGVGTEPVDLLDLAGRCGLLSNRVHCVISF